MILKAKFLVKNFSNEKEDRRIIEWDGKTTKKQRRFPLATPTMAN